MHEIKKRGYLSILIIFIITVRSFIMKAMLPVLDETRKRPYYLQLYDHISEAILRGEISAGEKLPSLRNLAKSTGLSITTIEQCYNQLHPELAAQILFRLSQCPNNDNCQATNHANTNRHNAHVGIASLSNIHHTHQ